MTVANPGSELFMVLRHRPEFFGGPWVAFIQDLMRGPSPWTVAERELFAAFVSRQQGTAFCAAIHGAVASQGFGTETVQATLEDWRSVRVPDGVRVTLDFLRDLTVTPESVGPADVERLRAAGLGDDAITDAIYVCAAFSLIGRVVDALGVRVPSWKHALRIAPLAFRVGYRL
jgi:uncharacterized peroxidase-related enzyme